MENGNSNGDHVMNLKTHISRICSFQEGGVVGRARFRNQNRSRSHSASSTDSFGSTHSSCDHGNRVVMIVNLSLSLSRSVFNSAGVRALVFLKIHGVEDNLVALHFKYDQARRRFVEWAKKGFAVVPDFHKRILFSDEAHFWLNGYVNKQNCRIWSEANPQVYVETPLHPEKLTVWCALWAGGILLQKR
ncbi:hypothetical protein TNCV_1786381 [Trichonephila clavipes]|nr:hypothetical protein TNCV_1786381 [Trichonephila clavipes]